MTAETNGAVPNGNAAPTQEPVVPRGYLGNLDEQQQRAFDEFKQSVEDTLGPCEGSWHDDAALIRFLRARKFSPQKALQQLTNTDSWRKTMDVDNLFANFDGEELRLARRHYPRWTGRRDRLGRPVYVYRFASLDKERQAEIASVSSERHAQRLIVLSEIMMRFMQGMATHLAQEKQSKLESNGTHYTIPPMSEVTSIIDFDGASIGQMWALRNHLKQATVMASAHYPETLGTMALMNVPGFFSMIWTWIQKWFDEGSRNKMFILGSGETDENKRAQMTKVIAPEDLPCAYGGQLDWKYEDEPVLDDDERRVIGRDALPDGPIEWVDGHMRVLAEGQKAQDAGEVETVNGEEAQAAEEEDTPTTGAQDGKPDDAEGAQFVNGEEAKNADADAASHEDKQESASVDIEKPKEEFVDAPEAAIT